MCLCESGYTTCIRVRGDQKRALHPLVVKLPDVGAGTEPPTVGRALNYEPSL